MKRRRGLSKLEEAVLRNVLAGRRYDDRRTVRFWTALGAKLAYVRLWQKGVLVDAG